MSEQVVKRRTFSKSKINSFKTCPRQYYFQNRTELGRSIRENPSHQVQNGNVVHKVLELFNDPNADETVIDIHMKAIDLTDDGVQFCEKNLANLFMILEQYGLGRAELYEQRVEDDELDLSGYIDAIYLKDGEYWIIDYKTGKFYKPKMEDYIFELYVYVILARRCLGINASKVGMFFTQFPKKTFVIDVTEDDYDKHYADMVAYMENMKSNNGATFPRARSRLCEYCKFINLCDGYTDDIIKD